MTSPRSVPVPSAPASTTDRKLAISASDQNASGRTGLTQGERIRFGIVGAGRAAQLYAEAFQQCPNATVVAVADPRIDAARALAEGLGCAGFDTHESMLAAVPLDAAVVCTPPATHRDLCLDLLARQVHVLCEKPFSVDTEGARAMLDAATRAGVQITMASKFRFVADVVRARSVVLSGAIGSPVLFENAFASRVDMSARWNSNPRLSGGGVLIDNGTHAVDLMRYFLGPLAAVQAVEGKRSQSLPVEDTVRLLVRSVSGVLGSIDLSWSIGKEEESYLRLYGTHGIVLVGWKESKYRQSSSNDWVVFGRGYDKIQAFRLQIDNFCGAIRGDEALVITADDALASVQVIEAAYAAMRRDQWIPLPPSGTAVRGSWQ